MSHARDPECRSPRRRQGHAASPWRIAAGTLFLGAAAVLLAHPVTTDAASGAGSSPAPVAVPVDRQAYVADSGPDIYALSQGSMGQDPVDIHVGALPGRSTYHSFVHVDLGALPAGATVGSLVVTLVPTSDPNRASTENVDPTAAILDAYPLTTELPANFDPSHPPAYDTTGPEVVGRLDDKTGAWSFDLAPMLAYWRLHGNTGAAIVPNAAATMQPWSLGFDRTLTTARAVIAAPAPTSAPGGAGATAPTSGGTASLGSTSRTGVGSSPLAPVPLLGPAASVGIESSPPPPSTSPAPTSAPANGIGPSSTHPGAQPTTVAPRTVFPAPAPPSGGVGPWLLVLVACLAGAAGLLAQPLGAALSHGAGAVVGLATQLRAHPRLFAVAALLVAWSTTYSAYSATLGRTTTASSSPLVAGGTTPSATPSAEGSSGAGTQTPSGTPGPSQAGLGSPGQPRPGAGSGSGVAAGGPSGPSATSSAAGPSASAGVQLFSPAEDRVGITDTTIQLCAHAALTFGPEFSIGPSDLNVYWTMLNDQGGIWGRKVVMNYQDDGYQPSKAVTAAQQCADTPGGIFFLLGGIGFDQIPAVRVWAEQHHMLYIHHIATNAPGLRYSFTMLPTLEQVGVSFAQYYLSHDAGQKIGIIYRNSSNWDPGRQTFVATLQQAGQGGAIVDQVPVNNNQSTYTAEIVRLQSAGAQVVLVWENALAATEIIQQAHNQGWDPAWLVFPFNLTIQTLDSAGVPTSRMNGIFPAPAYTCNAASQPQYAAYRSEIERFEAAYRRYDPNANLCGPGGDLLFATWLAWEQTANLLQQCGRDCTRNQLANLMLGGYHADLGAGCSIDFRGGDGHHGGRTENVFAVTRINNGAAWYNTQICVQQVR